MINARITITLTIIACICTTIATSPCLWAQGAGTDQPKKVMFDTDMCLDVDDVGALATLNALADKGEVELLAVCFNEVHKSGAAAIDAINTWYNRGAIPVGIYKGELDDPDDSKYLDYVAEFPHDLTNATAPNALDVYLQVLGEQPDNSVTIISVGFLNNIYHLLKADPDLISKKVTELVVMGGLTNDGFNLVRHNLVDESEYVIRKWPTPLVISDHGGAVHTGADLSETPAENPVREAYYRWFDKKYQGRSSWDQLAVLYGVRGIGGYFDKVASGTGRLRNGYEWQMKPGFRSHLNAKLSNDEYVEIIENLMIKPPEDPASSVPGQSVKQWDVFELKLTGSSTGNPFLDVTLTGASQRQRQKPETGPPRLASGAYANDTRRIHTHMHPARIVCHAGPNGLNTVECLTTRETPEDEVEPSHTRRRTRHPPERYRTRVQRQVQRPL